MKEEGGEIVFQITRSLEARRGVRGFRNET